MAFFAFRSCRKEQFGTYKAHAATSTAACLFGAASQPVQALTGCFKDPSICYRSLFQKRFVECCCANAGIRQRSELVRARHGVRSFSWKSHYFHGANAQAPPFPQQQRTLTFPGSVCLAFAAFFCNFFGTLLLQNSFVKCEKLNRMGKVQVSNFSVTPKQAHHTGFA